MSQKQSPKSDLTDYSEVIRRSGERHDEQRAELNAKLGEPAVFIPDLDDPRFGIGFWKAQGGVISYRRYVTGYDPFSRTEYDDQFIDTLVKVRS